MHCEEIEIKTPTGRIPAAVWGMPAGRCIVAAHGSMSHKKDVPIVLLAQAAQAHGWQVLSFDLPQHGARAQRGRPCTMRSCAADLEAVMQYARPQWPRLALFGCSMGAYAGLLACRKEALEAALFLSPVLDMAHMVEDMMAQFHIPQEVLRRREKLLLPNGQALYWSDLCYLRENPVCTWAAPTYILRGSEDALCGPQALQAFAQRFPCRIQTAAGAEHYLHTPGQLEQLSAWLHETLGALPPAAP